MIWRFQNSTHLSLDRFISYTSSGREHHHNGETTICFRLFKLFYHLIHRKLQLAGLDQTCSRVVVLMNEIETGQNEHVLLRRLTVNRTLMMVEFVTVSRLETLIKSI